MLRTKPSVGNTKVVKIEFLLAIHDLTEKINIDTQTVMTKCSRGTEEGAMK